jgi:hypothetical protein
MKYWHYVTFLMIGLSQSAFAQSTADSLINLLKQEIAHKDIYVTQKEKRILLLREQLPKIPALSLQQRFDLYNALYHEYKTFVYDTAFTYAQKLLNTAFVMKDKRKIGYARVKLGFILISSGMFKETFDTLNVVDVKFLHDTSRIDYYRLLGRTYSDLIIYNNDLHYRSRYRVLEHTYMDSALMYSQPGSFYSYYLRAVKQIHSNQPQAAAETVHALFNAMTLTYPQQAVNYYDLANAYRLLHDEEKMLQYMAMSSLADIRAATKETAAMNALARWLYERGDNSNAYIFIKQALDDAEFYGARQRKVEISSVLPLIASAELNSAESISKRWALYASGLGALLLLVAVFLFIIYKQLKRLRLAKSIISETNQSLLNTNQRLEEANKIKEEYLSYYFNVSSVFVSKIENFKQSIEHKLTTKKYDDIRHILSAINHKQDREELYTSFDQVFLKLFPDFVSSFNALFKPEDQVILKENQLLNTELRIFALTRMGLTDTEQIARILDYSVNTIYAYKTRVKSKSIVPNDEFEEKIMEIKSV